MLFAVAGSEISPASSMQKQQTCMSRGVAGRTDFRRLEMEEPYRTLPEDRPLYNRDTS
jgi:hypothetical protein